MNAIRIKVVLACVMSGLICACASTKMIDAEQQSLAAPPADEALIVFLRPSATGGAVQSAVYDATDGGAEFVGILSSGKKLAHLVKPGQHTFMVVSEAADFLEAEVEGGKTYYAMVTPRMGAWRARFSLHPVHNGGPGRYQVDSSEFRKWNSRTKLSRNTPKSYAWAEENHDSVVQKQREYWEVWQQKSPADLAQRTLNPSDGIK